MYQDSIVIRGLRQNNLKNVSLDIPKGKIVVFTGVSGRHGRASRHHHGGLSPEIAGIGMACQQTVPSRNLFSKNSQKQRGQWYALRLDDIA